MIPRRSPSDEIPAFKRGLAKGPVGSDPLRRDRRRIISTEFTPEEERMVREACRKRMEQCFGPGAGKFRIYVQTVPKKL